MSGTPPSPSRAISNAHAKLLKNGNSLAKDINQIDTIMGTGFTKNHLDNLHQRAESLWNDAGGLIQQLGLATAHTQILNDAKIWEKHAMQFKNDLKSASNNLSLGKKVDAEQKIDDLQNYLVAEGLIVSLLAKTQSGGSGTSGSGTSGSGTSGSGTSSGKKTGPPQNWFQTGAYQKFIITSPTTHYYPGTPPQATSINTPLRPAQPRSAIFGLRNDSIIYEFEPSKVNNIESEISNRFPEFIISKNELVYLLDREIGDKLDGFKKLRNRIAGSDPSHYDYLVNQHNSLIFGYTVTIEKEFQSLFDMCFQIAMNNYKSIVKTNYYWPRDKIVKTLINDLKLFYEKGKKEIYDQFGHDEKEFLKKHDYKR